MTFASLALALFGVAGVTALSFQATRDHRAALRKRARFFDEAAATFPGAELSLAPDGFPRLSVRLADGSTVHLEIIADTLVPRRLAQLWLKLVVREPEERPWPTLGVLARPTGAEFYALVPGFPHRLEPPFAAAFPVLARGKAPGEDALHRTGPVMERIFADPAAKEAVVTPRGIRIVRQLAQGDRAAHILFRQIRFPVSSVPPEAVRKALADAQLLRRSLEPEERPLFLEAS